MQQHFHHPPAHVRTWYFYGSAAVFGIIIHSLLHYPLPISSVLAEDLVLPIYSQSIPSSVQEEYGRPGLGNIVEPLENQWTLDSLREIVSQTRGYYARDYSLWLGWNNVSCEGSLQTEVRHSDLYVTKMRYIIEAAVLHAKLLNRTLVLPSSVYARSCEWKL